MKLRTKILGKGGFLFSDENALHDAKVAHALVRAIEEYGGSHPGVAKFLLMRAGVYLRDDFGITDDGSTGDTCRP